MVWVLQEMERSIEREDMMVDSNPPLRHPETDTVDDEARQRDARTHLAGAPHLQVVAELVAKLRASSFPWWTPAFTRGQWSASQRMQWLEQRPDARQRITTALTGLPRKAARDKTPGFQASLIDTVLDHGDLNASDFEHAFAPQDVAVYGPASDVWTQFRARFPWEDDSPHHQKLVGWLLRVLLSERSSLDQDMLRKPILSAWDVRHGIDSQVWQERIPLEIRAAVDDARAKHERARPREPFGARHELQIATPEIIVQTIPLSDLLPVVLIAERAMFLGAEASVGAYSVVAPRAERTSSGSFAAAPPSIPAPQSRPSEPRIPVAQPFRPSEPRIPVARPSEPRMPAVPSSRPFAIAR